MSDTSVRAAPPRFATFAWRVVAAHALTYFLCGVVAYNLFDYPHLYADTGLKFLMRPTDAPLVAVGPALQFGRGLLFAVVLWPFADRLLERGALPLWGLFVGLAVLGPAGAAPGSLEGVIYTTLPLSVQLIGLPEVIVQTGLFAAIVVAWCRRPARWMDVVAAVGLALVVLMSLAGWLAATGALPAPA